MQLNHRIRDWMRMELWVAMIGSMCGYGCVGKERGVTGIRCKGHHRHAMITGGDEGFQPDRNGWIASSSEYCGG